MNSILLFIVVLGILIFFHELGHFTFARLFGVGVERFSLGFGPRIFGRTVGRTDYRVSLIPLGGYVKMVGDEPNAPIAPEDIPLSFTHKSVVKRALIVAAGPFFNILLAFIIFSAALYFVGMPGIRPIVRSISKDSPAQAAGLQEDDLIRSLDGEAVSSWMEIEEVLSENNGTPLNVTFERRGEMLTTQVKPQQVEAKNVFGDDVTYYDIGASGFAQLGAVIDGVSENMPAERAGLKTGDQIVAVDGQPIDSWESMHDIVSESKGRPMNFKIRRGEQITETQITAMPVQEKTMLGDTQTVYRIGIRRASLPIPEADQITITFNPVQAVVQGAERTWFISTISVKFFLKLIQGRVPADSIGGPIRIAQMARQQASEGLVQLFFFVASVSVQLAILNLLPIPVLDGGHLLFFGIEAVMRRPVSVRMRETAQQVGIFLLLVLMIFVFYNDISMTWFR